MLGTGLVIDAALLIGRGLTSGTVRESAHWVALLWGIVVRERCKCQPQRSNAPTNSDVP